jgi:hypothetical protein
MAKARKRKPWGPSSVAKAERALALNKARLDSASGQGLASDRTLSSRGFDPDPQGGAPKIAPKRRWPSP